MLPSALTSRAACRFLAACLACLSLLTACRDARSALVEKRLEAMTLREKVGQMFFVRPEQLSPAPWDEAQGKNAYHQCVSENLVAASRDYPVGGILLLGKLRGELHYKGLIITEERIDESVRRILSLKLLLSGR